MDHNSVNCHMDKLINKLLIVLRSKLKFCFWTKAGD